MRILLNTVVSPFMQGGADRHLDGLEAALRRHGHDVCRLAAPFSYHPESAVERSMEHFAALDCSSFNGLAPDKLLSLQFPAWYSEHPDHVVWIMHQHRAAYELYDARLATPAQRKLTQRIRAMDAERLPRASQLFANSANVAGRLQRFCGLQAEPLLHPPHAPELFYCDEPLPYIFFPSRHETLKRQELLIEAMRLVRSPVRAILPGEGGQTPRLRQLAASYDLEDAVLLPGRVDDAVMRALYARCLGVFFGPFDEDLGYVTLEAMLSSKPVITCADSGGPLEFVVHGETGLAVEPQPEAVAAAIEYLWADQSRAAAMGRAGREYYASLRISWDNVLDRLLG